MSRNDDSDGDEILLLPIAELNRRARVSMDLSKDIMLYLRSAETLYKQANMYQTEGNLQKAYELYMRYSLLVLEELPKHHAYSLPQNRVNISFAKKSCNEALGKLEMIKPALEKQYSAQQRRRDDSVSTHTSSVVNAQPSNDSLNTTSVLGSLIMSESLLLSPIQSQGITPSPPLPITKKPELSLSQKSRLLTQSGFQDNDSNEQKSISLSPPTTQEYIPSELITKTSSIDTSINKNAGELCDTLVDDSKTYTLSSSSSTKFSPKVLPPKQEIQSTTKVKSTLSDMPRQLLRSQQLMFTENIRDDPIDIFQGMIDPSEFYRSTSDTSSMHRLPLAQSSLSLSASIDLSSSQPLRLQEHHRSSSDITPGTSAHFNFPTTAQSLSGVETMVVDGVEYEIPSKLTEISSRRQSTIMDTVEPTSVADDMSYMDTITRFEHLFPELGQSLGRSFSSLPQPNRTPLDMTQSSFTPPVTSSTNLSTPSSPLTKPSEFSASSSHQLQQTPASTQIPLMPLPTTTQPPFPEVQRNTTISPPNRLYTASPPTSYSPFLLGGQTGPLIMPTPQSYNKSILTTVPITQQAIYPALSQLPPSTTVSDTYPMLVKPDIPTSSQSLPLVPSHHPLPLRPRHQDMGPTKTAPPTMTPPRVSSRARKMLGRLENGEILRTLYIPQDVLTKFEMVARPNTERNLETCGVLCGTLWKSELYITHLVIPKQKSTSDTCTTEKEEELFDYQDQNNLITLGWIHTHPTQTCFMSSVDLHTHCSYQLMLTEAVAIVLSPRHTPRYGVFRLTHQPGLDFITNCHEKNSFHPHPKHLELYTLADYKETRQRATGGHAVFVDDSRGKVKVIDLRPIR